MVYKMQEFIECVKNYDVLWRTNHVNYKCADKKNMAWEQVARECELSNGHEARKQWKKLRDGHRQAIKSKKVDYAERPWKYEKDMEFLLPYMAIKPKSIDVDFTESFWDDEDSDDQKPISIHKSSNHEIKERKSRRKSSEHKSSKHKSNSSKRPKIEQLEQVIIDQTSGDKMDQLLDFLQNQQKYIERRSKDRDSFRERIMNKKSSLDLFFASMCDMTKELPKHLQINIQKSLFNSIMEAKEIALGTDPVAVSYSDPVGVSPLDTNSTPFLESVTISSPVNSDVE